MARDTKPQAILDMIDTVIEFEGENWKVSNIGGFRNEDGERYFHLANTVRGSQHKNGFCPAQIGVWIKVEA
jgi:hypothetical protein